MLLNIAMATTLYYKQKLGRTDMPQLALCVILAQNVGFRKLFFAPWFESFSSEHSSVSFLAHMQLHFSHAVFTCFPPSPAVLSGREIQGFAGSPQGPHSTQQQLAA